MVLKEVGANVVIVFMVTLNSAANSYTGLCNLIVNACLRPSTNYVVQLVEFHLVVIVYLMRDY